MNAKLKMLLVCNLVLLTSMLNAQVFETKILCFKIDHVGNNLVNNYSLNVLYEIKNISNLPQKYVQKNYRGHSKYDNMECKTLKEFDPFLVDSLKKEIKESQYLKNMFFVFNDDTVCIVNASGIMNEDNMDTVHYLQPNEVMSFQIIMSSRQIGLLFYCKYLNKFSNIEKFVRYFLKHGKLVDYQLTGTYTSRKTRKSKVLKQTVWF